ncbi:hypothetical protein ANOBCDAF_01305 [Pleomorphomonas sp. T1.2MG-36]|uniref:hypothetical protein n=1 Tax=Pleomorphomonas sp. T1.2MG-36 TaxID=3041167 RepID=UPI0024775C01|nr:hypothetical protein [Pleomorphomonas sp. T1.2MG-36]CAI9405767.1 hypothetical protein ANOBCDAF_01305 [Pleomorphomonas sp. T1.2MG-36]
MSGWERMARSMTALAATLALALQLVMPPAADAAAVDASQTAICHSDLALADHGDRHETPPGKAGCDWCMLCGKLGTAVGPLDRVAGIPQRAALPMAVITPTADPGHSTPPPQRGPVGARAPPDSRDRITAITRF